jgi:hypothetical protein
VDCLLDAFGPVPVEGASRAEIMSSAIHWIAAKIGKPGVGDAFAGVFSDAVSDPSLREILSARLQDPYRLALRHRFPQALMSEGGRRRPRKCGYWREQRFGRPLRGDI